MRMRFRASMLTAAALLAAATGSSAQERTDSPAYRAAVGSRTAADPKLIWTASQVALLAREVAPGVFAVYPDTAEDNNAAGVPEATSGGFIVGENAVLVIDTMLNRRLAVQMIRLIRERTGAPIRYIVNTSFHGDHSYGNQFFPADANIIQHRATRDHVLGAFEEDVAFMKTYFGENQGLDEIGPVPATILLEDGADLTLDLGGRTARVRHLGFAQTEGDLFVTAGDGSVVFTGNPVIASAPALPWLLDGHLLESTETLKALRALLPDDAVVAPGHGAPTDVAAIEHHIAYLEDLTARTRAAIAEGLSKEQTVEALQMEEYAGYKLHPWVHLQVNAPAAYDELIAN